MTGELPIEAVLERLSVRPPYYALQHLTRDDVGRVTAWAPIEQPLGREAGPMSCAETGRHLAILGSLAAAFENPRRGRHHYLAYAADLCGHGLRTTHPVRGLWCHARARMLGSKEAEARATLLGTDGEALFDARLRYWVLTARIFERMFREHVVEMRARPRGEHLAAVQPRRGGCRRRANPYSRPWIFSELSTTVDGGLRASVSPVPNERCTGHFPQYPSLPVSALGAMVSQLLAENFARAAGDPNLRCAFVRASLRADNLVFAGDAVSLTSTPLRAEGESASFEGRAYTDGGRLACEASASVVRVAPEGIVRLPSERSEREVVRAPRMMC